MGKELNFYYFLIDNDNLVINILNGVLNTKFKARRRKTAEKKIFEVILGFVFALLKVFNLQLNLDFINYFR